MAVTFYELLGVAPTAGRDEVHRAYRAAARRLHPDAADDAGTTAAMAALNEAWHVLSDPGRRAAYDRSLLGPPPTPPPAGPRPRPVSHDDDPFDEPFDVDLDDEPYADSDTLRRVRYLMAFWWVVVALMATAFVVMAVFDPV